MSGSPQKARLEPRAEMRARTVTAFNQIWGLSGNLSSCPKEFGPSGGIVFDPLVDDFHDGLPATGLDAHSDTNGNHLPVMAPEHWF
jgi:hypothetical protein